MSAKQAIKQIVPRPMITPEILRKLVEGLR